MGRMILADNAEHYVYMKEDLRRLYGGRIPAEALAALDDHLAELFASEEITFRQERSKRAFLAGVLYVLMDTNDYFARGEYSTERLARFTGVTSQTIKKYAKEHRGRIEDLTLWRHPEWEELAIDWMDRSYGRGESVDINALFERLAREYEEELDRLEDPQDVISDLFREHANTPEGYQYFLELADIYLESLYEKLDEDVLEMLQGEEPNLWYHMEARPYLRGLFERYHSQMMVMDLEGALETGKKLIGMMWNDNMGVRYTLYPVALYYDDDDFLAELEDRYSEDGAAEWQYNLVLDHLYNGDLELARAFFEEAYAINPHIPGLLTGEKEDPEITEDHYARGSIEEGFFYAVATRRVWALFEGALDFLKDEERRLKKKRQARNVLAAPLKS